MPTKIDSGGGYQAGYDDGNSAGYSSGYSAGYNSGYDDGTSSVKKIKKVVSYAKWRNSDHEYTNGFTIEFNEDGSVKAVSASIDGYGIPSSAISKTVYYYE